MARATREAVAVCWDDCHKIYIVQDEESASEMKNLGYILTRGTGHEMAKVAQGWYRSACPLRFVASVSSSSGIRTLVEQGA